MGRSEYIFIRNLPIHPVEPVIDVDAFALNMQQTIYMYLASTVGIVKKDNNQLDDKYKSLTVKQLKRELRMLKSNKQESDEIMFVSKLIRQRITTGPKKNAANVDNPLMRNFWTTCRKIFDTTEAVLPSFDVNKCYKYFKSILSQANKLKTFIIPKWIASLPLHQ